MLEYVHPCSNIQKDKWYAGNTEEPQEKIKIILLKFCNAIQRGPIDQNASQTSIQATV